MSRYSLGQAPRRSSAPLGTFNSEGDAEAELKFRLKRDVALREYYYLAGNMIKWITLYGSVPNQDSWVWDHYPAGEMWKEHVAKYGVKSEKDNKTVRVYHSVGSARKKVLTIRGSHFDVKPT